MDITKKAKQYAEGKAQQAITSAIEQAYTDGYSAGFKDCLEKLKAETNKIIVDGVEYVDLKLPTGTLWSKTPLMNSKNQMVHMTYDEASTLNIPDEKQLKELVDYCDTSPLLDDKNNFIGTRFLGRNGESIDIFFGYRINGYGTAPNTNYRFWLRDDANEDLKKRKVASHKESCEFMGNRIPVMLVSVPKK